MQEYVLHTPAFINKVFLAGVPLKSCSKIMQQTYKRTPKPNCDVNEVARNYWNRTSTWVFYCKFTAYIRKSFLKEHLRESHSAKGVCVWSNCWLLTVRVSTNSIPITRWTSTWKEIKYDFLKTNDFLKDKEKLLHKRDLTSFLSISSCQATVSGKMNRLWVCSFFRIPWLDSTEKKFWRYWAHVSKAFKFGTCHEILY